MHRSFTLTIPQPCSASWAAMNPTTAGRHCAACQKTVVDFTSMSDAEVLAYLARAAGSRMCGRFAAGQLERPLQRVAPAAPKRWRAWLTAAVAVWGLREVAAQEGRAQAPTEQRELPTNSPLNYSAKPDYEGPAVKPGPVLLRGIIVDSTTQEATSYGTVLIKGTTIGVAAHEDGSFELNIPAEHCRGGRVELNISAIGYRSQTVVVPPAATGAVRIPMQPDNRLIGELIIVTQYRAMPPAPWKPRAFYHWGKYWATRPFRHN
jgi:hypothetical protein